MIGAASGADHEFFEIYNPTATSIDIGSNGIHLNLHIRDSSGTDGLKFLTPVVMSPLVASHGFMLFVSQQSTNADAWFANRNVTYDAGSNPLAANGSVYLSLSFVAGAKVIDKLGWGSHPAFGYEGTAITNLNTDNSAERKPAGGAGHATDADVNASDFNAQSTTLTPRGTADAPQP